MTILSHLLKDEILLDCFSCYTSDAKDPRHISFFYKSAESKPFILQWINHKFEIERGGMDMIDS